MGLYENKNNSLSLLAGGTCYADSPVGAILPFGGSNPPSGYLLCDGQAVSRSYYAELFAVIGTRFGAGDGSTTFNVPNLKGKTTVGLDSSDTSFDAIGKSGGEKTHTLTTAEMPAHTHTQNAHSHDYNKITSNGDSFGVYGGGGYGGWGIGIAGTNNNYGRFAIQAATATNQNTGGGGAHNNLQPYVTTNYIIKAKQSALPLPFEDAVDTKISNNMIDSITDGSMKAVTSNAVYDAINNIGAFYSTKTHITTTIPTGRYTPVTDLALPAGTYVINFQYRPFANPSSGTLRMWYGFQLNKNGQCLIPDQAVSNWSTGCNLTHIMTSDSAFTISGEIFVEGGTYTPAAGDNSTLTAVRIK